MDGIWGKLFLILMHSRFCIAWFYQSKWPEDFKEVSVIFNALDFMHKIQRPPKVKCKACNLYGGYVFWRKTQAMLVIFGVILSPKTPANVPHLLASEIVDVWHPYGLHRTQSVSGKSVQIIFEPEQEQTKP